MSFDQQQTQERRLRVSINLPVGNPAQSKAIIDTIAYVRELGTRPETGITGYTYSNSSSTQYTGYWYSEEKKEWVPDQLILFYLDFSCSPGQELKLWEELSALKAFIAESYRTYGSQQDEVWIVSYPVTRTV